MKLVRTDGTVIFDREELDTHEKLLKYCLVNTIPMANADFSWADFSWVNFGEVDFRGADFRGADFSRADFSGADFLRADFRSADFRGADFLSADFWFANFKDADFEGVKGDGYLIKSMVAGQYPITLIKNILQIGCQQFTIEEWRNKSDFEIQSMDKSSDSLDWWNKHKELVFTFCALNENELK
jgi:uncharacterized protein YjbI with pentapeptide repeats